MVKKSLKLIEKNIITINCIHSAIYNNQDNDFLNLSQDA